MLSETARAWACEYSIETISRAFGTTKFWLLGFCWRNCIHVVPTPRKGGIGSVDPSGPFVLRVRCFEQSFDMLSTCYPRCFAQIDVAPVHRNGDILNAIRPLVGACLVPRFGYSRRKATASRRRWAR